LDDPPVLLGSPEDLDHLGLICTVAKTDARLVEHLGVDAHERGRALSVLDTAAALAEGTAGVELAGKGERAITAKLEALEPWAYGEAGRQAERPPQEHERELDALSPEGWRKPKALPRKRESEVYVPLRGGPDRDRRGRGHKAP